MKRIADHWWMFLVRGVTSFVFAALLLLGPGWSSIGTLAIAFGIWALVDCAGSLAFLLGVRGVPIAAYVARGGLGIAPAALALALPSMSTVSLYVLVGAWAIGTGALEMAFGSRTWPVLPRAFGFMVVGTLSLGFGLSVVHIPLENAAILRALLVGFAVVNGIAAIVLGEALHAVSPRAHLAAREQTAR